MFTPTFILNLHRCKIQTKFALFLLSRKREEPPIRESLHLVLTTNWSVNELANTLQTYMDTPLFVKKLYIHFWGTFSQDSVLLPYIIHFELLLAAYISSKDETIFVLIQFCIKAEKIHGHALHSSLYWHLVQYLWS